MKKNHMIALFVGVTLLSSMVPVAYYAGQQNTPQTEAPAESEIKRQLLEEEAAVQAIHDEINAEEDANGTQRESRTEGPWRMPDKATHEGLAPGENDDMPDYSQPAYEEIVEKPEWVAPEGFSKSTTNEGIAIAVKPLPPGLGCKYSDYCLGYEMVFSEPCQLAEATMVFLNQDGKRVHTEYQNETDVVADEIFSWGFGFDSTIAAITKKHEMREISCLQY